MVSSAHCREKTNFFNSTIHLHEEGPPFFLSRKRRKVWPSAQDNSVSHICIGNYDVGSPSQPSTQESTLHGYLLILISLFLSCYLRWPIWISSNLNFLFPLSFYFLWNFLMMPLQLRDCCGLILLRFWWASWFIFCNGDELPLKWQ